MKEYEILYDTGSCRKLVAKLNRIAKEGWEPKSIGGLGNPAGISAVYVLIEREITKPKNTHQKFKPTRHSLSFLGPSESGISGQRGNYVIGTKKAEEKAIQKKVKSRSYSGKYKGREKYTAKDPNYSMAAGD